MAENLNSDEQIIAKERQAYRTHMQAGVLSGLALGIVLAAVVIPLWQYFDPLVNAPGIPGVIAINLPPLLIIGAAVLILWIVKRRNPIPKEATTERIVRQQVDDHQRRGAWLIWLFLLLALNFTFDRARNPPQLGPGAPLFRWEEAATFVFFMATLSLIASLGRGFARRKKFSLVDDELSRFLRGRAVQFGYLAIILALCAAYLAILYQPAWAVSALPWVMFVGVATPLICFQILQWQAGHGG